MSSERPRLRRGGCGGGWLVGGLLLLVQTLDVAVHVAAEQVEPVRILSNCLLVGFGGLALAVDSRRQTLLWFGATLYLLLNLLFLGDHGIVNPRTDSLRIPLFGFVVVSLGLTAWLSRLGTAKE